MPKLTDARLKTERIRILAKIEHAGDGLARPVLRGEFSCKGDAADVFRPVREMILMANRQGMVAR